MFTQLADIDDRQFRALTGLPKEAFFKLLPVFEQSYHQSIEATYQNQKAKRKRRPGAGQKGKLVTMEKKLFFILYYLKVYPTFDVLGYQFGLDRSKACTNVHRLLPVLIASLNQTGYLPKRQFDTVEQLRDAFAGIEQLFIDATERPVNRPKDAEEQKIKYSGKKKRHTVKNTIITTAGKMILFLGYTINGSRHDYGQFKHEFPPEHDWFETFKLWVDLGYLGIKTDYDAISIDIPHKKPRKSKANPNPQLTENQKQDNRAMSRIRVVVEQAIGSMKRFNILVNRFRNRKANLVDDVALVTAGLSNFLLPAKEASLA